MDSISQCKLFPKKTIPSAPGCRWQMSIEASLALFSISSFFQFFIRQMTSLFHQNQTDRPGMQGHSSGSEVSYFSECRDKACNCSFPCTILTLSAYSVNFLNLLHTCMDCKFSSSPVLIAGSFKYSPFAHNLGY